MTTNDLMRGIITLVTHRNDSPVWGVLRELVIQVGPYLSALTQRREFGHNWTS